MVFHAFHSRATYFVNMDPDRSAAALARSAARIRFCETFLPHHDSVRAEDLCDLRKENRLAGQPAQWAMGGPGTK